MHYLGTPTHCCLYCCATGPRQPDHSPAAASGQLSFGSGECAREHRRLVDNGMRRTHAPIHQTAAASSTAAAAATASAAATCCRKRSCPVSISHQK